MITMTKSYNKLKHQVKSNKYYLFWGAATIAVMAGQIYVGTGYRNMSESIDKLVDAYVNRPRVMPADKHLEHHEKIERQTSQYQIAFVADQEINLLAALTEIMLECEFK